MGVGIVYSARVFIWQYHGNEDPDGELVESSAKSREDKRLKKFLSGSITVTAGWGAGVWQPRVNTYAYSYVFFSLERSSVIGGRVQSVKEAQNSV